MFETVLCDVRKNGLQQVHNFLKVKMGDTFVNVFPPRSLSQHSPVTVVFVHTVQSRMHTSARGTFNSGFMTRTTI